ncbi:alpha/beta fold hydrolase [bacterium]|nr:alpha/beta fold hydrolase [bacterium]
MENKPDLSFQHFQSRHGNVRIAYSCFKAEREKAVILFLTGRAEYFLKYRPFFERMNELGFTVFSLDHRGQGASGRMLDESEKGYVENFDFYVDDAEDFFKNIVLEYAKKKDVFLVSHSMGGAISLLLASRCPDLFTKIVFTSPMWGLIYSMPETLVKIIVKGACCLGFSRFYAIGKSAKDYLKPFEKTHLTQSFENYMRQQSFVTQNRSFALGGPSFQWVSESIKAMEKLPEAAEKVKVPVLLVQAENDTIVENKARDRVAANFENCRKTLIEKGFHELLNEEDEFYEKTLAEIKAFLLS